MVFKCEKCGEHYEKIRYFEEKTHKCMDKQELIARINELKLMIDICAGRRKILINRLENQQNHEKSKQKPQKEHSKQG